MELHEVTSIKELIARDREVNELLAEGWKILSTRVERDGDHSSFVYLLGRSDPKPLGLAGAI